MNAHLEGAASLDDWNAQFGSLDDFTKRTGGGGRFAFEFGLSYKVRIKQAQVVRSENGNIQIQMDLAVLDGDDNEVGKHKEWLTLPKQPADIKLAPETVVKLTLRRRDDLVRIMSQVEPERFRLYASVGDAPGGKSKYFNADGNEMTPDEMNARQVEINRAAMELADVLHSCAGEAQSDWIGAEFYLVKNQNPKSDKYPYTNFYARPSPKLKVWTGE